MYIPAAFDECRPDVLASLIADHPLGLLISNGRSGLAVSPIPFLYRPDDGNGTLAGHVARANPHWKDLDHAAECLVVFQGADAYVTPSWYPSKRETRKVVPTWNYEVVELKGAPRVVTDEAWLRTQVAELTGLMERRRAVPWRVSDAPDDFIQVQAKAIVGVEIRIVAIAGKWKMSQNRTVEDAQGVVDGLSDAADPHSNPGVAAIVSEYLSRRRDR